jgi:hypothetical protein
VLQHRLVPSRSGALTLRTSGSGGHDELVGRRQPGHAEPGPLVTFVLNRTVAKRGLDGLVQGGACS